MLVDGERFDLIELAFHLPSEHQVQSRVFDFEIQFSHANHRGERVIVAVLGRAGRKHGLTRNLWPMLPSYPGHIAKIIGFNPIHLLPRRKSYYRYSGSETIPPCRQGIRWMILEEPIQISQKQIGYLDRLIRGSARPLQPVFTRVPLRSR